MPFFDRLHVGAGVSGAKISKLAGVSPADCLRGTVVQGFKGGMARSVLNAPGRRFG